MKTINQRKATMVLMLAVLLLVSMLPLTASAATSYNLWIGGEEVTSTHKSGKGWSYNSSNNTLTLDNFSYSGDGLVNYDGDGNPWYYGIGYWGSKKLTIALAGDNSIKMTADVSRASGPAGGISLAIMSAADLVIKGTGSLTAVSSQSLLWTSAIEVYGNLTIEDGNIHAVGGNIAESEFDGDFASNGILAQGNLKINGGTVTAESGEVNATRGASQPILGMDSVIINDGTVNAIGKKASLYSFGVSTNGKLTIAGGKVTATGGEVFSADGESGGIESVQAKDNAIEITGGTLVAAGGAATGKGGTSYGILSDGTITITRTSSIVATGYTAAIGSPVKTAVRGNGWTDIEGTEGKETIQPGDEKQTLTFLNVRFPVVMKLGK